ncbi:hypothetical protein BJ912DRAFT_996392 [Pholiota molesta]|nr:hypothetical protein BJ912DRAFT_996392 [Pholiota molesta]
MSPSAQSSRRLLARLHQDLSELNNDPYPGVAVFTDDADLRKLCLVLIPPSGPWKDMALHFNVSLPGNWPTAPPRVTSSVSGINHPNLLDSYICCDLLQQPHHQRGYTGGYTPALTLRGLFLQFLTFFSSTKVDQDNGTSYNIGDQIYIRYAWQDDLATHAPGPQSCHQQCVCEKSPSMQSSLSSLWDASTSEEIALEEEHDGVIHKKMMIQTEQRFLHKLEWVNPRRSSTLTMISRWSCPSCPYGSPELPHLRISSSTLSGNGASHEDSILFHPPAVCKIDNLNDDVLFELAAHLSSETIVALSHAYPRFHEIVVFHHILQRLELTCFFLRLPLQNAVLGIGVALDQGARTLSSDFDWLSMEAFNVFSVRQSIEKRGFQYFLPLAFNRLHFDKVHREVWKRLATIDLGLRNAESAIAKKTRKPSNRRIEAPQKAHYTVDVLYRMMNNIVVSLMKSCDNAMDQNARGPQTLLHASEKAIVSYCHLFHLLIRLCEATPEILQDVNVKLRLFLTQESARNKAQTPDIGELIVVIMLAHVLPRLDDEKPRVTWEEISGKFLQEVITRNVRWVLKDAPELELLEKGASDYRLIKTFQLSKTSLRLIMFQMTFLGLFSATYASDLSRLDSNYGFPEKELPERMVAEIKVIYQVDSWPKFFNVFTKETFSQMLRECVQLSAARKYHVPNKDCQSDSW